MNLNTIFDFADEMEILQRLQRTGFVMSGVTNPQTVGEHYFGVSLWVMLLVERMENKEKIDVAKVLKMATLHEIAETRISDIPMPGRKYLGDKNVSDAERKAAKEIFENFPDEWLKIWSEFEDAETLEARIVKAADKLEMMHKILCYEKHQNGSFKKFWEWDKNFPDYGITEAREIFIEMKERHFN